MRAEVPLVRARGTTTIPARLSRSFQIDLSGRHSPPPWKRGDYGDRARATPGGPRTLVHPLGLGSYSAEPVAVRIPTAATHCRTAAMTPRAGCLVSEEVCS